MNKIGASCENDYKSQENTKENKKINKNSVDKCVAMFGDNLSFISDTTIAATTTQGIVNKEKFKANIFMVGPAVIITVVALALYPIDATKISAGGAINFVNLVPYILIIALSLAGMHLQHFVSH